MVTEEATRAASQTLRYFIYSDICFHLKLLWMLQLATSGPEWEISPVLGLKKQLQTNSLVCAQRKAGVWEFLALRGAGAHVPLVPKTSHPVQKSTTPSPC